MTAQATIRLVLLMVSWSALLIRSKAVTSHRQRPMWLALLALAIEMLLLQAPVAAAVHRLTGMTNLTVFVGGFCHLAMTTIIWTVSSADPRAARSGRLRDGFRWWFTGATVVVMLVTEVLATVHHDETRQRALPGSTSFSALTVGWFAYLLFVTVSSADATLRLWRLYRGVAFPALRLAIACLCAGTTASLVYVAGRVATVLNDSPLGFHTVMYASMAYFLFFSFGCVTAVLAPLVSAVRAWAARCRLYRFWRSVTEVVPEVVLEDCPSLGADLVRIRRNNVRLQRRIIEIQDATLALREWVTPAQVAVITDEVAARGLVGEQRAAAVTAGWLRLGRAAKRSGRLRSGDVPDIASTGGADLDSELRWLLLVRRSYRDAPEAVPATRVPAR